MFEVIVIVTFIGAKLIVQWCIYCAMTVAIDIYIAAACITKD